MSTAIRHAMAWNKDEEGCIYVFPVQQADGNWIKYAEYAKLEAEVERLRASSFVTAVPAEGVERIVKAGDGLYKSMLEIGCNEMADNFQYDAWWGSMKAWQATKEGETK